MKNDAQSYSDYALWYSERDRSVENIALEKVMYFAIMKIEKGIANGAVGSD